MLLHNIAVVALCGAGLAGAVRAAPWSPRFLSKKPLACALCMAFHGAWIMGGALSIFGIIEVPTVREALATVMGATGAGTFLLAQTGMFAPPLDLP